MSAAPRFQWLGTLILVASILCWSAMPPMLKALTPHLDGWVTNGVRYPFAALLWLGPLILQVRRGEVHPRIWTRALAPTFFNVIAQVLWAWIPYYLDATLMGFLVRISVVFSIGGGFLLFPDERRLARHPIFWLGVMGSALGFGLMSFAGEQPQGAVTLFGVFLVLACGAFYGLYTVAVRYSLEGSRPWVAFPVISLYTSVALLLLMFAFGEPERLWDLSAAWFGFLLLSAVIGIASAHTLFYMAIERLGVAISSSTQLVSPFLTFLWAFLFLGERLTSLKWLGGSILLGGGLLLVWSQTHFIPAALDPARSPVEPEAGD